LTRTPEKKDVYLARFNRKDGLGAVVHSKLIARALANYFGMTYVDMSVESMEHQPADSSQEEHGKFGDRFFGIGEGQLPFSAVSDTVRIHHVEHLKDLSHEPGTLNVLSTEKRNWKRKLFRRRRRIRPLETREVERQLAEIATDLKTPGDIFIPIKDQVREVYDRGPARDMKTDYASDRLDIAVHVRRGDVVAKKQWLRFKPNSYYLNIIQQLERILGDQPHRFHVFSQTKPKPSLLDEDFTPFEELGCCMHLDEDMFESINHLVQADILVASKSSFSFLPSVLSHGVVLYDEFLAQANVGVDRPVTAKASSMARGSERSCRRSGWPSCS